MRGRDKRAQRQQVQAMKRGLSEGSEEPESTLMELADGTLVDFSEPWALPPEVPNLWPTDNMKE